MQDRDPNEPLTALVLVLQVLSISCRQLIVCWVDINMDEPITKTLSTTKVMLKEFPKTSYEERMA